MSKFRILLPAVNILRALDEFKRPDGSVAYEHESVLYLQDEIVDENDISPVFLKLYDEGDPTAIRCVERIPDFVDSSAESIDSGPLDSAVSDDVSEKVTIADLISNYDDLTINQIMDILPSLDDDGVERVKAYEARFKDRKKIANFELTVKAEV